MIHHPDRGGDSTRFAEINEAYSVLSDPTQREQHDNPNNVHVHFGPAGFGFDNIFNMFGASPHSASRPARAYRIQLWTGLSDSAMGGARQLSINTPRGASTVEITLPRGYQDGDSVRYPGIAPDKCDLIVTLRIHPDKKWERQGDNITTEVSVQIWDLILGTTATVVCLDGTRISLTIPPRTQPHTVFRVKNHGMPLKNGQGQGDLLVRIQASLPEHIPDVIIDCIRQYGQP